MKHDLKKLIGLGIIFAGSIMAPLPALCADGPDHIKSLEQCETECVHERGRLVRSDFLGSATREEVAQGLAAIGWSDVVVKSGISLRRLVYTTIDAHGEPTIASGLLALPTDFQPIGVVSFAHGTDSLKSYVPSAPTGEGEGVAALFASGGFALVAPDYVGLGLSPGPHPYLQVETEASASLDLLTAARRAANEAEMKLPRSVYITGFSQGGQAALALDRSIETDSDSPWRVAAIAPIAGPYDLSGTEFPGMVDGPSSNSSAYLAYLTLSYIQIYGGDMNEVFASPYNTQVLALFDGKHAFNQIAQVLPSPRALFRPEFLEAVRNGRDPFASELGENDTVHVTPRAPVRLYYGEADVDVFPGNAQVAAAAMRAAGAQVTAVDLGVGADHPASENLGLPAARAWFDQVAVQQ